MAEYKIMRKRGRKPARFVTTAPSLNAARAKMAEINDRLDTCQISRHASRRAEKTGIYIELAEKLNG